jgi:pyruvate dehydrogenase E2 component (dihydrolipoamide acetyltransferase)
MPIPIVLSALYPEMEEATIGRWRLKPGDAVAPGQAIAELITDKVAYDLASEAAGTVLAVLAAEKSVVPVGTTLLVLGEKDEALAVQQLDEWQQENHRLSAAREASLIALTEAMTTDSATPVASPVRSVRATPAARRLARERGVDLATVQGSGPDGMITADDIPS